jgi:hypothetical protein
MCHHKYMAAGVMTEDLPFVEPRREMNTCGRCSTVEIYIPITPRITQEKLF